MRSFRTSGSQRFRRHAGLLLRWFLVILAIAIVLAAVGTFLRARG